jgi:hypothetical protein
LPTPLLKARRRPPATLSLRYRPAPAPLPPPARKPSRFLRRTIQLDVILAWPLLVLIAAALAWTRHHEPGGRGWRWFFAWSVAGFLMSFSLVTGFSIGLFILPVAAGTLIWAALRSPHPREASGFLAGVAATVALMVAVTS